MPTSDHAGPSRNLVWRFVQLVVRLFSSSWVRLSVAGTDHLVPTLPGLVVANHQSYLDPLMLAVRLNRPVSYVARDSLFRIPGIGWLLRRTYVTPISRDATRAATIRTTLSRLKEGFLVGMFPEGTRSSGTVKAFRPGFGAVLRRADVPVYPVGIAGADHVLPRGAWFIRPRRIIVVFGPPISIAELAEKRAVMSRDELVEFVRGRVAVAQEDALRRLEQRGGIVNE